MGWSSITRYCKARHRDRKIRTYTSDRDNPFAYRVMDDVCDSCELQYKWPVFTRDYSSDDEEESDEE